MNLKSKNELDCLKSPLSSDLIRGPKEKVLINSKNTACTKRAFHASFFCRNLNDTNYGDWEEERRNSIAVGSHKNRVEDALNS